HSAHARSLASCSGVTSSRAATRGGGMASAAVMTGLPCAPKSRVSPIQGHQLGCLIICITYKQCRRCQGGAAGGSGSTETNGASRAAARGPVTNGGGGLRHGGRRIGHAIVVMPGEPVRARPGTQGHELQRLSPYLLGS